LFSLVSTPFISVQAVDGPSLVSPSATTTGSSPTYAWTEVEGASWYYLWVDDAMGYRLRRWYRITDLDCTSGSCSVTPSLKLEPGQATWGIYSWGTSGYQRWSGSASFTVQGPSYKPVLVSPKDVTTGVNPTYSWQDSSNATYYYLYVSDSTGYRISRWYRASDLDCTSDTCSVIPSTQLEPGEASWWVYSWTSDGYGPRSDTATFTVEGPSSKPILISPIDVTVGISPSFSWQEVEGVSWYYLSVDDSTGTRIRRWYATTSIDCTAGSCSVTSGINLEPGQASWQIRAWTGDGYTPWSDKANFTIDGPSSKPILVSPEGTIATATPSYTWEAVSGASWYYLSVDDSAGSRIRRWYRESDLGCSSGTCSITPSVTLAEGAGNWQIRSWSNYAYGPYSDPMSFTVSLPNDPPQAGNLTPSSCETNPNEQVSFNAHYSDPDGSGDIRYARFIVHTDVNDPRDCLFVSFDQTENKLYLKDDTNTSWLGGFAPGSSHTIENTYATLDCSQTTIQGSGSDLSVTWSVSFKDSLSGVKNLYLYAEDEKDTSNWQERGEFCIFREPVQPTQ